MLTRSGTLNLNNFSNIQQNLTIHYEMHIITVIIISSENQQITIYS